MLFGFYRRGDPVSLISSGHTSSNNPNHTVVMNNEFAASKTTGTTSIVSSNASSSSKRVQPVGQSSASTLVSVNLNIDFNPGGGPMPRRQRRVQMKHGGVGIMGYPSNQNRMPSNILKKNGPLELTLSSSKLTIPEENNQMYNKTRLPGDNTVEPIWWPPIENSPVHLNNANSSNPIVMDNSMSTSAAWTASTTGVMSDRSSVYSIDGDFEREASHKVNKQLKEIESILYEKMHSNQHNHNHTNINEYEEWSLKFPHLRFV